MGPAGHACQHQQSWLLHQLSAALFTLTCNSIRRHSCWQLVPITVCRLIATAQVQLPSRLHWNQSGPVCASCCICCTPHLIVLLNVRVCH